MTRAVKSTLLLSGMAAAIILLLLTGFAPLSLAQAQSGQMEPMITGLVLDSHNQPVEGATVSLLNTLSGASGADLPSAVTQHDGTYSLLVKAQLPASTILIIQHPHFQTAAVALGVQTLEPLRAGGEVAAPHVVLKRNVNASFWISTIVFAFVLALIALGKLHNTLSSLLGASILFLISYLVGSYFPDFYIFDFAGAIRYVNWNVIFLIMGMMIVIAVVERTGLFQWLAFHAFQMSRGRAWVLLIILMLVTGITSAFLDNVTTMLLVTPITIEIALAMGTNPLALLMPEVFASNLIGISTLIGTPTNILIGSFAHISFTDFLVNLTPGVLISFTGLVIYSLLIYQTDLRKARESVSESLLQRLEDRSRITQPLQLRKAGVVGLFMLLLFIFGEHIHLLPSVVALMGATALMVWIRPDVEEMIEAVDWTTLVFFISLFIVVGAVQEVGLISLIADYIGRLVGSNLMLALVAVVWISALLSTVIANIPFTAAMLPVVGFLTASIPGADTKVLFFCLSVGSAMGGNGSLIGASANMVMAGISDRAGYRITYGYFLKKGFPALLLTVALATVWLLVRFLL